MAANKKRMSVSVPTKKRKYNSNSLAWQFRRLEWSINKLIGNSPYKKILDNPKQ